MDKDIEKLENEVEPWSQLPGESRGEYELFKEYVRLGVRRSLPLLQKNVGTNTVKLRNLSANNNWDTRVMAFDQAQQQLAIDYKHVSPEDTLAYTHAVGICLLDIGIQAIQAKNPSLIKMGDAVKMLQIGADMARKGAGFTDTVRVQLEGESVQNINKLIEEITASGEVVEEAEVVSEDVDAG